MRAKKPCTKIGSFLVFAHLILLTLAPFGNSSPVDPYSVGEETERDQITPLPGSTMNE